MAEPVIAYDEKGQPHAWDGQQWRPIERDLSAAGGPLDPTAPENLLGTPEGARAMVTGAEKGIKRLGGNIIGTAHRFASDVAGQAPGGERNLPYDPEVYRAQATEQAPKNLGEITGGIIGETAATLPLGLGTRGLARAGLDMLTGAALAGPENAGTGAALGGLGSAAGAALEGPGKRFLERGAEKAALRFLQPSGSQSDLALEVAPYLLESGAFTRNAPFLPKGVRGWKAIAEARAKAAKEALDAATAQVATEPVRVRGTGGIEEKIGGARQALEVTGGAPVSGVTGQDIIIGPAATPIRGVHPDILKNLSAAQKGEIILQELDPSVIAQLSPTEITLLKRGMNIPVTLRSPFAVGSQVAAPSVPAREHFTRLSEDVANTQLREGLDLSSRAGIPLPTSPGGAPVLPPEVQFQRLYRGEPGTAREGLLPQYDRMIREFQFDAGRAAAEGTPQATLREEAQILRQQRREQFPELEPGYQAAHKEAGFADFMRQRERTGKLPSSREAYDVARIAAGGAAAGLSPRITVVGNTGSIFGAVRELFQAPWWTSLGAGTRQRAVDLIKSGFPREGIAVAVRAALAGAENERSLREVSKSASKLMPLSRQLAHSGAAVE